MEEVIEFVAAVVIAASITWAVENAIIVQEVITIWATVVDSKVIMRAANVNMDFIVRGCEFNVFSIAAISSWAVCGWVLDENIIRGEEGTAYNAACGTTDIAIWAVFFAAVFWISFAFSKIGSSRAFDEWVATFLARSVTAKLVWFIAWVNTSSEDWVEELSDRATYSAVNLFRSGKLCECWDNVIANGGFITVYTAVCVFINTFTIACLFMFAAFFANEWIVLWAVL